MLWIYGCLIFIIGVIVGMIATRLGTKGGKKHKELQKELEKSQYELEQYRQELVDHFAQSANLMENISKDYEKLYSHMAKTSTELMPNLPTQDNPFTVTAPSLEAATQAPEQTPEQSEAIQAEAIEDTHTEATPDSEKTEKHDESTENVTEPQKDDTNNENNRLLTDEEKKKSETEKPNNVA